MRASRAVLEVGYPWKNDPHSYHNMHRRRHCLTSTPANVDPLHPQETGTKSSERWSWLRGVSMQGKKNTLHRLCLLHTMPLARGGGSHLLVLQHLTSEGLTCSQLFQHPSSSILAQPPPFSTLASLNPSLNKPEHKQSTDKAHLPLAHGSWDLVVVRCLKVDMSRWEGQYYLGKSWPVSRALYGLPQASRNSSSTSPRTFLLDQWWRKN